MTTTVVQEEEEAEIPMKIGIPSNLPEYYPFKSMDDAGCYNPHQSPFHSKSTCVVCGIEELEDVITQDGASKETTTTTTTTSLLKRCSRCSLVHYCCRDHQIQDYKKSHKETCRKYSELNKFIHQKKQTLDPINHGVNSNDKKDDDDDDDTGTTTYVDKVVERGNLIYSVACQHKSLQLVEQLVLEYMDHFTHDDLNDVRRIKTRLPFLLLELGREEDAVRLCRFWLLSDRNTTFLDDAQADKEYETFFRPIFQTRSDCKRGEWCYGHANGKEEIIENCWEYIQYHDIDTLLLLVICIAKMKLVANIYSMIGKYSAYTETRIGKQFEQGINPVIKGMIFGDNDTSSQAFQDMKQLQKQIPDLLRLIHDNNATLLPALINPEPFLQQVDLEKIVHYHHQGNFEHQQVYEALQYARDIFIQRTPGVLTYLQNCFGQRPTYFI